MQSITLMAAVCWLINGLHATHDLGPSSRKLIEASFPRIPFHELDDNNTIYRPRRLPSIQDDAFDGPRHPLLDVDDDRRDLPAIEFGTAPRDHPYEVPLNDGYFAAANRGFMFLRHITHDLQCPAPMLLGAWLDEIAFEYLVGASFIHHMTTVYATGIFSKPHPNRTRTKVIRPTYVPTEEEVGEIFFEIGPRGHEVIDPATDVIPVTPGAITAVTWRARLTGLYRQTWPDIMGLTPNPRRGKPPYSRLTEPERQAATEASFSSSNLALSLTSAVWKQNPVEADWQRVFDYLFPRAPYMLSQGAQNFAQSRYFILWTHFLTFNDQETIDRARDLIYRRIRSKVAWMPSSEIDRVWRSTGTHFGGKQHSPNIGPREPAPKVICSDPYWDEAEVRHNSFFVLLVAR
jgi:hypothetical protein